MVRLRSNRRLMEIIDERLARLRLHGGAGSQLARLFVELLPATLVGRLAFLLVTAIALKLLVWDQLRQEYSAARVRLRQRRSAGIPDSDKRPFSIAVADIRSRRETEERRRHGKATQAKKARGSLATRRSSSEGLTLPRSKSYGQAYIPAQPSPLRTHPAVNAQNSSSSPSELDRDESRSAQAFANRRRSSGRLQRPNFPLSDALIGSDGHAQHVYSQSTPPEVPHAHSTNPVDGSKKRRAEESEASYATDNKPDIHTSKRTKGESPAETGACTQNPAVVPAEDSTQNLVVKEDMAVDMASRPSKKRPLRSDAGISEARETSRARKVQRMRKSTSERAEATAPRNKPPPQDVIDADDETLDRRKTVEKDLKEEDERVRSARLKLRSRGKLKSTRDRQVSTNQGTARSTNLEVKDEDREPGDEWENSAGDLYRKDKDGQIQQLVELFQPMKQHKMVSPSEYQKPLDSVHTDTVDVRLQLTKRWLTSQQLADASDALLLKIQQSQREQREQPTLANEDVDMEIAVLSPQADHTDDDPLHMLGTNLPLQESIVDDTLSSRSKSRLSWSPNVSVSSSTSSTPASVVRRYASANSSLHAIRSSPVGYSPRRPKPDTGDLNTGSPIATSTLSASKLLVAKNALAKRKSNETAHHPPEAAT